MKTLILIAAMIGILTISSIASANEYDQCKTAQDYAQKVLDKLSLVEIEGLGKLKTPIRLSVDCRAHGQNASYGNGLMNYSASFISISKYEDEIAFILAHELTHALNNHPTDGVLRSLENEADLFALQIMYKAGYNPRYALSGITKAIAFISDCNDEPNFLVFDDGAHLPLPKRLEQLQTIIDEKQFKNLAPTLIPEETLTQIRANLKSDD